jgi:hypothetical protein
MASNDDIKKVKDELKKLKSQLDQTTAQSLQGIIDKLTRGKASLSEWNTLLDTFSIKADAISDDLDYVSKSLSDSVNSLVRMDENLAKQVRSTRKLSNLAQDALSMRRGDELLDKKKLKSLELQILKQKRVLQSVLDVKEANGENVDSIKADIDATDTLLGRFTDLYKAADKFGKSMGITGGILKGMSKIPILGDLIGTEKALSAAQEAAKDGASKWGTFSAAIKSTGKSLASSLSDPLVSIGLLVKGFKMFLELGLQADTQVTNLAKSMAVSKDEAALVRGRMVEIQNSSDNILMTTKNQVEAQLELADAFGATRGFTEQQVADQVLLTKNMGLQADEAAGIQQLAQANSITAEQVTGSVVKQTAALARQTGIQLNNKKIIGEVAKVSGQLRLQYANNPKLIAQAVIQTEKLGVSLEQAAQAAQSLLDFESSIENELSAELLTGKELNLERARLLALNGDSAAAVAEMNKQLGGSLEFSKMNVIQQEALAKSVGMSADELANSLVYQENLNKLGSQTRKQVEEQIELAKQQGDQDKVNLLQKSLGNEKAANDALKELSAQEKFNAAMDKLKAMVGSIVEGPAQKFVDMLSKLAQNATLLKVTFGAIAGILAAIAASAIVTAFVTNPIGASIGLAAGLGAAYALHQATKVQDGMIDPKGGLVVSGGKGSIQLDPKDSIIAGTNLTGGKQSSAGYNNSNEIRELKNMVAAIASRPINVSIDGEKVIKATTGRYSNTQGDEVGKNSYKIQ